MNFWFQDFPLPSLKFSTWKIQYIYKDSNLKETEEEIQKIIPQNRNYLFIKYELVAYG